MTKLALQHLTPPSTLITLPYPVTVIGHTIQQGIAQELLNKNLFLFSLRSLAKVIFELESLEILLLKLRNAKH